MKEALERFRAAIGEGSHEALLPTLTLTDQRAIRERLNRRLPLFRVEELQRFFHGARRSAAGRRPGDEVQTDITVTLSDADRARADIAPLLSFRPCIYLAKEAGGWRVDLSRTLRALGHPRPKEETISICRRALQGIADEADLLETEHFLIFAHTGPEPARTTAQLLEELYDDFQEAFPFDLGRSPSAESADLDGPGPDHPVSRTSGDCQPEPTGPEVSRHSMHGPDPYMVVFLFSYKDTFRRFLARHNPDAGSAGGYATPSGYFVTRFHPAYRSVVRHEGAHLLMYRRMHLFAAPSWLAEGIAETMSDDRDIAVVQAGLRRKLLKGKELRLGPMMRKEKISFGADYQTAHSLIHFLRHRHAEEWEELARFLRRLPPRPQPEECHAELLKLLGTTQAELDEEWRGFVLGTKSQGDDGLDTAP